MYPVAAEDEQMQPGEQRTFRMSRRGCWRGLRAAHCGVGLLAAVVALSRRLLAMARHRRGLDATEWGLTVGQRIMRVRDGLALRRPDRGRWVASR